MHYGSRSVEIHRYYCPSLIKGIIAMHQFAYGAEFIEARTTHDTVLRFIRNNIGMGMATDIEVERMEIMSYNSGAAFAPEDAWPALNLIYSAYDEIQGIDCTFDYLTIVGIVGDNGIRPSDIQEAMNAITSPATIPEPRFGNQY